MINAPIPVAPGFSAPGNLTPDELAEFMRRLRFSGSSMTNATIDPLGQRTDEGPTPEGQALPQTPEAVSGMLEFAKQAAPSINGSYTANVMKKLGRATGPAAPTNAAEYESLRPSDVYDLPSDAASRKQFMDTESAKQTEAKSAADVEESKSRAALHGAQATSLEADTKGGAATVRAIADIMRFGQGSMDPADVRALGRRAAEIAGVTPEGTAQAKMDQEASTAATELKGATEGEAKRKGSLMGKVHDFLAYGPGGQPPTGPPSFPGQYGFGGPLAPNENQQIIARGGVRPDAGAPPAGPPPIGSFNPMPGQAAGPTAKDMVPTNDPNVWMFNGLRYRRLPTGGFVRIDAPPGR